MVNPSVIGISAIIIFTLLILILFAAQKEENDDDSEDSSDDSSDDIEEDNSYSFPSEENSYKNLQNILSDPVTLDQTSEITFTGDKDTDLIILNKLSDNDLVNVCSVNKYVNKLCQNESFWLNRTVKKFGKYLGKALTIKKNSPPGIKWKDYYLWLSGLTDKEARNTNVSKLLSKFNKNTSRFKSRFKLPILVSENMREFMSIANLGLSDPSDSKSAPL
ncbi:unnamed protein product, partial [marine sediment metagenome]